MKNVEQRVNALREYMSENGLNAFIVVSSDAHSSEYVADRWKAREWITGFDGSAGTAVITQNEALLWTDSRYWLAAEKCFADNCYRLMKEGAPDTPTIVDWLCSNMHPGDTVGVDGTVCSVQEVKSWSSALSARAVNIDLSKDPFSQLWSNRPTVPLGKAEIMPVKLSGESAAEKINRLRKMLSEEGADGMVVTMLDEIAWLTNLRGCDVEYNPVVVAYMIVTTDKATLFIDSRKLSNEVREYLLQQGITVDVYDNIWQALDAYDKKTILLQPTKCNAAIAARIGEEKSIFSDSPIAKMKAVKNETEIVGFRSAMLAEGIAMTKLLYWLKPAVEKGGISELDVDRKLTELRSENKDFRGLSFSTIAAYGENAAIVHYEPTEEENKELLPEGFLLLDCGGQYSCGTTDITRTIALGKLTQEQKEDYTRVLRGHISLAKVKFPKGASGTQLDVLARQWLWQAGENYLHGTGHGVGHFLNVHEGPHQIRMNYVPAPLMPGMTVTNEPGLYKAGRYGIRIENTMLVTPYLSTEFGEFCALQPLTMCPIDKTPIIPELLGMDGIEYLNNYHAWVFEQLSPYFEEEMFDFLKMACAPL